MGLDTSFTIAFAVMAVGGYIAYRISCNFVSLKYWDQKVGG